MLPLLSIVVPMYHDRSKIGDTIESLANFFQTNSFKAELIVVNDGGTDGGVAVVEKKMKKFSFLKLINRSQNRGKGFSVREGMVAATGEFIFFTDADLPYLTEPIKKMLTIMMNKNADFVLANRDIFQSINCKQSCWPRQITHLIYSHFVRLFLPIPFSDTLAGLKGMNRKVITAIIPRLTIDRFSFDVELLLIATKLGYRVRELPVSLQNVGRSNLSIRRDAPIMASEIIQIWRQLRRGYYD